MTEAHARPNVNVVEEFRLRLWEQRRDLLRTLALTDDELATLEAHQAGAVVEDAATQTVGAILSRLEGQQKHELDEIEDALTRLENGTFGICQNCDGAIPLARLRAMPAARRCLDCQREAGGAMTLAFRGIEISGLRDSALRASISGRLSAALKPVQVKPLAAQVAFFDDNGPKGGRAVRCALTVRLPYRATVRVEHTAETLRLAFDATFKSLERQLQRYLERDRNSRRHPKKYYVAKRLLEAETAAGKKARKA